MTQAICWARRVAIRRRCLVCGAIYRMGAGILPSAPAVRQEHDHYWACSHKFGPREASPYTGSIAAPVFPHLGPEEQ